MRLIDYFDRGLELEPDRDCLVWDGGQLTYREADARITAIAQRLCGALGAPGAPVAILSPNAPEALLLVLGIARAEAVWVPVNARGTTAETAEVLAASRCRLLFVHPAFAAAVPELREQAGHLEQVVLLGPVPGLEDVAVLDAWLDGEGAPVPEPGEDPHRLAVLGFTGGTTGTPKGVMLTDLNLEAMVASVLATVPFEGPPTYLAAAPITHAAGALCFPMLALGGTIVVLGAPAPDAIFDAVEAHGVDTLFLPPTVIYMLLDAPGVRDRDLRSIRHFIYAAAPMSPTRLAEAMEVFGPVMVQLYGQTEAPMICTAMTAAEHETALQSGKRHRLSSCGRPAPFVRLAILDEEGRPVAAGERGEVCVRGTLVMAGYFEAPEETARSRHGAWHRTGDVGYLDDDGYLYLVDRVKDMIITGGFNVYSTEVERVVAAHPAVAECVVVGTPDDRWGEVVTAVVTLRDGAQLTPDELIAHCRADLSGVKTPKRVEIRETLPRNTVGKVLKRSVRDEFWAGAGRSI